MAPKKNKLKLQVFFDNSIVEVFANDGEAITAQIFPGKEQQGIKLFNQSGSTTLLMCARMGNAVCLVSRRILLLQVMRNKNIGCIKKPVHGKPIHKRTAPNCLAIERNGGRTV